MQKLTRQVHCPIGNVILENPTGNIFATVTYHKNGMKQCIWADEVCITVQNHLTFFMNATSDSPARLIASLPDCFTIIDKRKED